MALDLTGKTLEDLRKLAEEKLDSAESAENVADKKVFEDELDQIVGKYNEDARNACYMACRDSEKPLAFAIALFYYEGIKVAEKKNKDTQTVYREIGTVRRPIDITAFWKWMKGNKRENCGIDPRWFYYAQKLNFCLTVRAAERLGDSVVRGLFKKYSGECYALDDIARKIDAGKSPTTNRSLLRITQDVVNAMLGAEYKVTSTDINMLCDIYARDNRREALGITLPNHNNFRALLKKMCYRLLTGIDGYSIESREFDLDKARELAEAAANGEKPDKPAKAPKKETVKAEVPVDEEASDEPDEHTEEPAA